MKKYMFELQAYKKIYVEAENIEEARDIACYDDKYLHLEVEYVSDGEEIKETEA